jgi:hypothetical protein
LFVRPRRRRRRRTRTRRRRRSWRRRICSWTLQQHQQLYTSALYKTPATLLVLACFCPFELCVFSFACFVYGFLDPALLRGIQLACSRDKTSILKNMISGTKLVDV